MDFKSFFKIFSSSSQEKKQKTLITIFVIILIITAIIMYLRFSGFSIKGNSINIYTENNKLDSLDKRIEDIDFDINFLNYLENMEIYGTRPTGEIEKGKENPFSKD